MQLSVWKPVHCLKLWGHRGLQQVLWWALKPDETSQTRCCSAGAGTQPPGEAGVARPLLVTVRRTWTGGRGSAGTMAPSLQKSLVLVLPEHTKRCLPVFSLPLHLSCCPHVSLSLLHMNLVSSLTSISLVLSVFITFLLFSLTLTTWSLPFYQLVSVQFIKKK